MRSWPATRARLRSWPATRAASSDSRHEALRQRGGPRHLRVAHSRERTGLRSRAHRPGRQPARRPVGRRGAVLLPRAGTPTRGAGQGRAPDGGTLAALAPEPRCGRRSPRIRSATRARRAPHQRIGAPCRAHRPVHLRLRAALGAERGAPPRATGGAGVPGDRIRRPDVEDTRHLVSGDLTSKTLGIVGLGGIGLAAARIGKAFGMRVIGTRRTPAGDETDVDLWLPPKRLPELLETADYVVLCVPLTDATRHSIGAAELAAMRSDSVLINVARGDVVDEPALIDALRDRRIRGATLDVAALEPLPPDSPLWSLDNCVITPHDAGYSPRANERLAGLFFDNLSRYVAGEPLRNEIRDVALSRS
ncbi:MAG: hypothetical protein JRG84_02495 [Deltaproteobacteria bacterium]|nr:hypothetical protein [Deltaproteobacteria bacterium]